MTSLPPRHRTLSRSLLNELIKRQYGEDARLVAVKRAPRFGGTVFVVDYMERHRLIRLLGSVADDGHFTEQSGMDMLHPERLAFSYERLQLLAFAMARRTDKALLLGLGGGAMYRHLKAYLPDCELTVVELDETIIDIAGAYFRFDWPVLQADAEVVLSDATNAYDVIHVDLYDARGVVSVEETFWQDCARALRSGGWLAVNWAEFADRAQVAEEVRKISRYFAGNCFALPRGYGENLVQLASKDEPFELTDLEPRLHRLAKDCRLPREDRDILERCEVSAVFPVKMRPGQRG